MNADLTAILYIVAGILFILALRGLSSPETARRGNRFGLIGMAVAVFATPFPDRFPSGAGAGAWPGAVAGGGACA